MKKKDFAWQATSMPSARELDLAFKKIGLKRSASGILAGHR